jgi:molybdopterin molybdotransferase
MISVEEARKQVLSAIAPLGVEQVSLAAAVGRTLAEDVAARVTQPPLAVSAMDGYAVQAADVAAVPTTLRVVGSVPAGRLFAGAVQRGEAVRIYTGAPLPAGADAIIIQEDTETDGERVRVKESAAPGRYVRKAGLDFAAGEVRLRAGRVLTPRDIGLVAAMNVPWLTVRRKPRIAVLATGDEIVQPGEPLGPGQIVSSNSWALSAFIVVNGGEAINIGVAPDEAATLRTMAQSARGADLLLTSGGASVGDHDLVRSALGEAGLAVDFWRIAMRPGKPLMFGRLGATPVLGLPGNPVSSLVCSLLFLGPMLARFLGRADTIPARAKATLGAPLMGNDRREDYLRARLARDVDGTLTATPFATQDSSMMALLAEAGCLVVRAPLAPALPAGVQVDIIPFPEAGWHI